MADILRQVHDGRYIASNKNGHISTNVQRQKLSDAASESVCCNASPQQAQQPPRQPWDAHGVRPGNPPGHGVMVTRK